LCQSQAWMKEEGSAEGLQPTRVKHSFATETVSDRRVNQIDLQRQKTDGRSTGGNPGSPQMKTFSVSQKEAETLRSHMFNAKSTPRIGTWNVRTLNKPGCLEQVVREMSTYRLAVLGISGMRWKGHGMQMSDGMTIYYSGTNKHVSGVGFILDIEAA